MVALNYVFQGINIPLPLLIFLFGGIVSPIIGLVAERLGVKRIRELWTLLISILALGGTYLLYQRINDLPNKIIVMAVLGQKPPFAGCFEIDLLSLFMVGCITFLGVLVTIYSIQYMEKESRLTEFYTLFLFMLAGMAGIVMSGDFFTLFIFWELMSLSSYVLVAFLKNTWGPIEAGFKYLIMSATAGAFLLLSMSFLYGMTGTLNFAFIAENLHGAASSPWLILVFSTLLIGFGVKAAIVPLHTWLPDAHPEAPSPISALLSGVVIETGLYALTRVLFIVYEPNFFKLPIAVLAVVTMTLANITALLQEDIKRMLAYSSIAQIGYMLVGLSAGTAYGVMGLFLHVFNHSLMKGMAFLSAGSLIHEADTREIKKLQGIGRRMPLTTLSLFIALFGLGGVPGTNGFISKFILFNSAIGSGLEWLAVAGILNSALSMGYYLRTMRSLISEPVKEMMHIKEAPKLMVGVTLFAAILIIITGLFPSIVINAADVAARSLVEGLLNYIEVFSR
jgi:proton-translocating NADH-quinone oxidoreductase chain N